MNVTRGAACGRRPRRGQGGPASTHPAGIPPNDLVRGQVLAAEELHHMAVRLDSCSIFYGVYEKAGGEAQLRRAPPGPRWNKVYHALETQDREPLWPHECHCCQGAMTVCPGPARQAMSVGRGCRGSAR